MPSSTTVPLPSEATRRTCAASPRPLGQTRTQTRCSRILTRSRSTRVSSPQDKPDTRRTMLRVTLSLSSGVKRLTIRRPSLICTITLRPRIADLESTRNEMGAPFTAASRPSSSADRRATCSSSLLSHKACFDAALMRRRFGRAISRSEIELLLVSAPTFRAAA